MKPRLCSMTNAEQFTFERGVVLAACGGKQTTSPVTESPSSCGNTYYSRSTPHVSASHISPAKYPACVVSSELIIGNIFSLPSLAPRSRTLASCARCIARRETLLSEVEKEATACSSRFLSETRTNVEDRDVVSLIRLLDQVDVVQIGFHLMQTSMSSVAGYWQEGVGSDVELPSYSNVFLAAVFREFFCPCDPGTECEQSRQQVESVNQ